MALDMLGTPVKRNEDPRFITGKGRYLDDIKLQPIAHVAILRSPYAHAHIRSIDTSAAKAMPGVLAVFTGADIPYNPPADGLAGGRRSGGGLTEQHQHAARRSRPTTSSGPARASRRSSRRPPSRRYDALDAIEVDWEPLPAVVDAEKAIQPGAPQLHENAPNNVVFDWISGDKDGTDAAIDGGRGGRPPAARQPAAHPQPDGGPRATSAGTTRAPTSTRSGCPARRRTSSGCCSPPS